MMKEGLENLKYEPMDQPEGAYYASGVEQLPKFQELVATLIPNFSQPQTDL